MLQNQVEELQQQVKQLRQRCPAEPGWAISGGGKAGRQRRGAQQQRAPDAGPAAASDPRFPQWECGCCFEWNWATRRACRTCRGPRELGATADEIAQMVARHRAQTPATGANAVPVQSPPAAATAAAAQAGAPRGPEFAQSAKAPMTPQSAARAPPAGQTGAVATPAHTAAGPQGTTRRARAQVRTEEADRVAKLDAALAALRPEDEELRTGLAAARRAAAERLASTRPVGQRLEQARAAHTRAVAALRAAEAAAAAAAERAEAALEAEHTAAATVAEIEREIAAEVRPLDTAGPARRFLEEVQQWAAQAGAVPPASVDAAADALKAVLNGGPDEESPTDLEVSHTPTEEAGTEDEGEARQAGEEDAKMRGENKRPPDAPARGPAQKPRRPDTGPYVRAASR